MFIYSDADIPACHFMVWPDFWYHTDKDRPDKSDPTQLKRVAFIGATSALSMCSGDEEILRDLIRTVYEDRLGFIQDAMTRSAGELSKMKEENGGTTYQNAVSYIEEAVDLTRVALNKIKELTQGKKILDAYLNDLIANMDRLPVLYKAQLKEHYKIVAKHNGFKPVFRKQTSLEKTMMKTIPVKTNPIPLGGLDWLSPMSRAVREHSDFDMGKIYFDYSFQYLIELYIAVDGKRTISQIKKLMDFEFKPMAADDFMKIMNAWEKGKIVKFNKK
jgi:hypothetical protein